jgi:outer membrane protein
MKKLLVAVIALAAILLAGNEKAAAQNKMGYFNIEQALSLMPGISKIDTLLYSFQQDSLGAEYDFRLSEFQRNDSTLKADSAKMPAKMYQEKKSEMVQKFLVLQNWQQYSNNLMQAKQEELLAPFYNKVLAAFQQVVEEGKYTYVFKPENLWIAPPSDDLLPLVAKKLGLKLPTNPNAPAQSEAPANKPAAKPAAKKQ